MEGSATRPPAVKLKINIRRLPPGLTEAEFEAALGEDWLVGKGRVDWAVYKPGKISKEYVPHITTLTDFTEHLLAQQSPLGLLVLT